MQLHHQQQLKFQPALEFGKRPEIIIGEIILVILLSALFDSGVHRVRRHLEKQEDHTSLRILDALFKEITVLGFIGLMLLFAEHLGAAEAIARKFGTGSIVTNIDDEDPCRGYKKRMQHRRLLETFETVHMVIFLLLMVMLLQATAFLLVSRQVARRYLRYERLRTYGSVDSLEQMFVDAGYLERPADGLAEAGAASPGSPVPGTPRRGSCCVIPQLEVRRPFRLGTATRILLWQDPLHKVVKWRSRRREFLFPSQDLLLPEVKRVPNPDFFSFEAYLRIRLGETAISLVELDSTTWLLTLLLLVIPLFLVSVSLTLVQLMFVVYLIGCMLMIGAVALTWCLESDLVDLQPVLPEDAREILRLMEGTRYCDEPERLIEPSHGGDTMGSTRCRVSSTYDHQPRRRFSTNTYKLLLRLLGFWQAVTVTSLIILHWNRGFNTWCELLLYCLTWAEWPIMLFFIVPLILRRLTMLSSIHTEKDERVIREVCNRAKAGFLRFQVRLVQLLGFRRRAARSGESWALPKEAAGAAERWTPGEAQAAWRRGRRLFAKLPQDDQLGVARIFEICDKNHDGAVGAADFANLFLKLGLAEDIGAAMCLLRLVDRDGSQALTLSKFQAMVGLAIVNKPNRELKEDLQTFFAMLDANNDGHVTVNEIARWVQKSRSCMREEDISALLCQYFSVPKTELNKEEFQAWLESMLKKS